MSMGIADLFMSHPSSFDHIIHGVYSLIRTKLDGKVRDTYLFDCHSIACHFLFRGIYIKLTVTRKILIYEQHFKIPRTHQKAMSLSFSVNVA